MKQIVQTVRALALPVAEALGLELWDVEYVKEAGQWYLRVYLDKDGGVTIDDCEAFSRQLDPLLDEADPIPDSYIFEVSSAGAERVLKRPSDFQRFLGAFVEVKLYRAFEGAKTWTGTLRAWEDGDVCLETAGTLRRFSKGDVAQVRLRLTD